MTPFILVHASMVLFMVGQLPPDKVKSNFDALQGEWKCVFSETGGKSFEPVNDLRIKIEKDTLTEISGGEDAGKMSFKIDPTENPKRMECIIVYNKLIPESKGRKIVRFTNLTATN